MEDFLLLDSQLTEDERVARDTIRQFVTEEVIPLMGEAYEKASFPMSLIPKCAELGLFGLTLPSSYGGLGANYVTYGLICQELERGDSGLRSFISVQNALCMYPIFAYGSEEQRKHYLPKMVQGEYIGCFGLTEANAGSDPGQMTTFAKKIQNGWLLNGAKLWITNATIADIAIVWAKTEEGIRGFIVEKDFEGFKRHEIHHKMSLRASNTGELVFSDCFVPDSHILPNATEGLSDALKCLTEARYGIAWGAIGAALACYESALAYCKERHQFNKPLASFQLVQKDLVSMYLEIIKAQVMNYQLGRLKDKGLSTFTMVSLAKLNACREALKIARKARNLLGANGISLEYPVIRHMMNLEAVFTYEGTDNIHHLIVGKELTGYDAFN